MTGTGSIWKVKVASRKSQVVSRNVLKIIKANIVWALTYLLEYLTLSIKKITCSILHFLSYIPVSLSFHPPIISERMSHEPSRARIADIFLDFFQ